MNETNPEKSVSERTEQSGVQELDLTEQRRRVGLGPIEDLDIHKLATSIGISLNDGDFDGDKISERIEKIRLDQQRIRAARSEATNKLISSVTGIDRDFFNTLASDEQRASASHTQNAETVSFMLGKDTSPDSVLLAVKAEQAIRQTLEATSGDHVKARKQIMQQFHPDVAGQDSEAIIPFINKVWDSERRQFKL